MFTPLHMHALEHFVTICPLDGRLRVTFSTRGLPFSQFVLQKVILEDILSHVKRAFWADAQFKGTAVKLWKML